MDSGPQSQSTLVFSIAFFLGLYSLFVITSACITRGRIKPIKSLAVGANPLAAQVSKVFSHVDYYLLSSQVGIFMSALMASWSMVDLFQLVGMDHSIAAGLRWIGIEPSPYWQSMVGAFGCGFFVTLVALSLVRVLKSLAFRQFEKFVLLIAPFIIIAAKVLFPITLVVDAVGRFVVSMLGISSTSHEEFRVSAEDISQIAEQSSEAGEIEEDELEMIQGVFTFSDTSVQEVMTPRKDIISVRDDFSLEQVLDVIEREGMSRVLVTGRELDKVKGFILAKDLLPLMRQKGTEWHQLIRPGHFVPGTTKIDDLLQEMRAKAVHLAIVLDEHGGVDGIVTLEDLIEEIVGEILDEFDVPAEELSAVHAENGDLLVDGGLLIDDLNAQYGFSFAQGEYKTIAGLIFHQLGRIPIKGEIIESQGVRLKIEGLEKTRITEVRILSPRIPAQLAPVAQPQITPDRNNSEPGSTQSESNPWEKKGLVSGSTQPRAVGSK